MGPDAMILVFLMLSFNIQRSFYILTLIKKFFSSSTLSALEGQAWSALFSPYDQPRNEVFY